MIRLRQPHLCAIIRRDSLDLLVILSMKRTSWLAADFESLCSSELAESGTRTRLQRWRLETQGVRFYKKSIRLYFLCSGMLIFPNINKLYQILWKASSETALPIVDWHGNIESSSVYTICILSVNTIFVLSVYTMLISSI